MYFVAFLSVLFSVVLMGTTSWCCKLGEERSWCWSVILTGGTVDSGEGEATAVVLWQH